MDFANRTIHISRAVIKAGLDLETITRLVSMATWEQFTEFAGQIEMDVIPIEIHMDFVIVQNVVKSKYYKANYKIDKDGKVTFADVQEVKRTWSTIKQMERSEQSSMVAVYWSPPTTWGNVLMRRYE